MWNIHIWNKAFNSADEAFLKNNDKVLCIDLTNYRQVTAKHIAFSNRVSGECEEELGAPGHTW